MISKKFVYIAIYLYHQDEYNKLKKIKEDIKNSEKYIWVIL